MAAFAPLFSERCRYLSLLNWRRQASLFVLNFLFLCLWAEGLYFLLLQREQHVCMLQSTSVVLGKYRMSGLIAVCFSRIYSGNQNGTLSTQYSVETKKLATSWKWGKMFCWFLELFWPPCLYFPVRETPKKNGLAHGPKPLAYSWPKYAIFTAILSRPDQKFHTLFLTWHSCHKHILWSAYVDDLIDSRLGCKHHTLFKTKIAETDTVHDQNG